MEEEMLTRMLNNRFGKSLEEMMLELGACFINPVEVTIQFPTGKITISLNH